ncbi:MAG TPA: sulfocyanin-like copper-binding protein [Acidimicrobiales bacterium]|nr:sulfocyanin-like copper-binding protein [Acidimicrobiales bacterium]
MTATAHRPQPTPARDTSPPRRRRTVLAVAAALAASGLGVGLAMTVGGSAASSASAYGYYQSVMGRYGIGPSTMMGGSGYGWMTGPSGYGWMMGGASAPGWMTGGALPGFMAGGGADPGQVMGSLFAGSPGPRVSAAEATRLGAEVPAGAGIDRAADTVAFSTTTVRLTVVASPSMPAENFRIAGLTDPTIVVPAGARISIRFINADGDMAHGLVVTSSEAASSWMPMMTSGPAFPGAAVWFLGGSTSAGMHEATVDFTASTPGSYRYLCPVPGHAREGMAGTLTVR